MSDYVPLLAMGREHHPEHDIYCTSPEAPRWECCVCEQLAKARADERVLERERIATAIDDLRTALSYSVEGYWTKRVSDALDAAARVAREQA